MIKCGDGAPLRDLGRRSRDRRAAARTARRRGSPTTARFPGRLHVPLGRQRRGGRAGRGSRIPYREVPYAEDQLLGRELIEAGYAKVFHPRRARAALARLPAGAVPAALLRRVPLAARGARPRRARAGPMRTPLDVRGLVGARQALAAARRASERPRARAARWRSRARHHAIRHGGRDRRHAAPTGCRAPLRRRAVARGPRLLHALRRAGRARCWRSATQPDSEPVELTGRGRGSSSRRALPAQAGGDASRTPATPTGPMTLAWVVPPWQRRLRRAHDDLPADPPARAARAPLRDLRLRPVRHVRDRAARRAARRDPRALRAGVEAPVFRGLDDFDSAPTSRSPPSWWTAFPVRDLPGCREKAYLVQDDEPRVLRHLGAVASGPRRRYRMGYRCIAYTPWMADILRERVRARGALVRVRHRPRRRTTFAGEERREPDLVAVYARRETERRAVELALAGLATLRSSGGPTLRVVALRLATWRRPRRSRRGPRRASAARAGRAVPARRASGVVFSLTTHSLVAQEMMASGLPVVELEGDNVTLGAGRVGRPGGAGGATPDAIADALERLLDDRDYAAAMARAPAGSWRNARGSAQAIRSRRRSGEFLSTPRSVPSLL